MTATSNGHLEQVSPASLRTVVAASAAGTAFEWYDFFIFVPLAGIIAKTFASNLSETAGLVFALGSFAAGFAFRPVGALIFGRVGDRSGRKGAFLITISLMGFATFAIGLLPTYGQAGIISPILFICLRLLQGIALGGEWGGAAIYMAEHTRPGQRGGLTSWLGSSAGFGLAAALLVVLATRTALGETAFAEWGWRVPFLASIVLFAGSLLIRMKLHESPAFQKMKDEGTRSTAPYTEAFLRWKNLKIVLIALVAIMVAQGAVWYTTFFYAQVFIERVVKVAPATVNEIILAVVIVSAPLYIFFGWLSDRIGRKTVMVGGMLVFVLSCFWGFHAITHFGNPALEEAQRRAPVTVVADPDACTLQFDPVGKAKFRSSCDIAKSTLANAGISYSNQAAAKGTLAVVKVGDVTIPSAEGGGLDAAGLKALKAEVDGRIKGALKAANYPAKADPARTNAFGIFAILMVFAVGATALYGPQAAALVELFPTRIRYTALSLPYHIGTGWVGGFLPATVFAMVAASGDIYYGLWYPVLATALSIVVALIFLPETRKRDLHEI